MDDARIKQLADEVMAQLGRGPAATELEERVTALERTLRELAGRPASGPARASLPVVSVTVHPSHQLVDVPSGSTDGRCVLEPDRPCVGSGLCRTLGH
jgi:hypothetical protein